MKNFSQVEVGDSIYRIEICNTEIDKVNPIMELKVKEIEKAKNSTHSRIKLSNHSVIAPSGMLPFHTISYSNDTIFEDIDAEIYATDREECIRIASNTVKIKMQRLHKAIDKCKDQLDKLGKCTIDLFEMSKQTPVEVMAETVIV